MSDTCASTDISADEAEVGTPEDDMSDLPESPVRRADPTHAPSR